jgi:hypothetical protein
MLKFSYLQDQEVWSHHIPSLPHGTHFQGDLVQLVNGLNANRSGQVWIWDCSNHTLRYLARCHIIYWLITVTLTCKDEFQYTLCFMSIKTDDKKHKQICMKKLHNSIKGDCVIFIKYSCSLYHKECTIFSPHMQSLIPRFGEAFVKKVHKTTTDRNVAITYTF